MPAARGVLSLAWSSNQGLEHITSITAQPGTQSARTWTYQYEFAQGTTFWRDSFLKKAILPDNSAWQFDMKNLAHTCKQFLQTGPAPCPMGDELQPDPWHPFNSGQSHTGSITAPSGLTGTFTVTHSASIREPWFNDVYPEPLPPDVVEQWYYEPSFHNLPRITGKTYTGPGVDDTWRYAFGAFVCCSDDFIDGALLPAKNGGVPIASLAIKHPDGHITGILVDNHWRGPLEGKVVGTRNYKVDGDTLTLLSSSGHT